MKIALIGLGDIAQKAYLPMLAGRHGIEWVLCSRNPRTLHKLMTEYGFRQSCSDYRALPEHQIDAVMIHAATTIHYTLTSFFLDLGIPTFVDKPLCDNYAGCEALYELAAQNNTPLFVGFNRRYLPLIAEQTSHLDTNHPPPEALMSLRWEKHRHNLPGNLRSMIFDDFIHVLDSVNLNGELHNAPLQLTTQFDQEKLARIDCHWQYAGRIYQASMNRLFGATCERVSFGYRNKTLELDSLVSGHWLEAGQKRAVSLADWTPMLAGKGFYAMLEHWLAVVSHGDPQSCNVERNLSTHLLCEKLCNQIESEHQ